MPVQTRLIAVAAGAESRALIRERGAAPRIVAVGNRVGNAFVASIEPGRMRLSDGTLLELGKDMP